MDKIPSVYILANRKNGTLYTGVTSNLVGRIMQHQNNMVEGFSKKYQTHTLVYYECAENMYAAITREKQLKAGSRAKKIALIESINPEWRDLFDDIV